MEVIAPLRSLDSSHIVPVEDVVADASGYHWLVTPYLGSADGLLTLDRLRDLKDNGQLSEHETERAVEHLLAASESAHGKGLSHGPVLPSEVLVNRHGSLAIELYGLARRLAGGAWPAQAASPVRAEVRSIAEIAYTMLTGTLEAPEPYIPASRLVKRLSPRWDAWLGYALDKSRGFESAAEAKRYLPSGKLGLPRPDEHDGATAAMARPRPTVRRVSLAGIGPWRPRHGSGRRSGDD
jgi:serine/threonine protein kinase